TGPAPHSCAHPTPRPLPRLPRDAVTFPSGLNAKEASMTIPRNALLGGGALAVALAFACTEGHDPAAPEFGTTGSATHATSYSGRATVVQATVLGLSTKLGDTGPLPSSGGAEEASLLDASVQSE